MRVWRPSPCAAPNSRLAIPLQGPESVRLAGGIGVRLAPESVFGLPWNQCSAWSGISVRLGAEYAVTENIDGLQGKFNSDMHWLNGLLRPGQRSSLFKYQDLHNSKNAKTFSYL